jgi:hypothetical protein
MELKKAKTLGAQTVLEPRLGVHLHLQQHHRLLLSRHSGTSPRLIQLRGGLSSSINTARASLSWIRLRVVSERRNRH